MNPQNQSYQGFQTPYHTHNKADSPQISFTNLINRFMVLSYTLFGTQSATSGNYSTFFTAPFPMVVNQITEVHTAAGTDGSAVSLNVEKLTGTTAPGSGTVVTTSAFNLKGAINTVVAKTYSGGQLSPGTVQLDTGNRLALKLTGTPTSVANVTVTLILTF